MLAALDALDIKFCHLATHSTGGIIAARMMLMQPERFGRVFALDPVTPLGMSFNADQIGLFRAMMASKELTRAMMATAAVSLFVPESLAPNAIPRFREGLGEIQALFERILEQTFGVSEEIWIGTPVNLTRERESKELELRMAEIRHPHLVLWGERDGWIAPRFDGPAAGGAASKTRAGYRVCAECCFPFRGHETSTTLADLFTPSLFADCLLQ